MTNLKELVKNAVGNELLINEESEIRSHICCSPSTPDIDGIDKKWKVFLAGPIQGAESWQHEVPNVDNVIFFSPRRNSYSNFSYEEQIKWEKKWMNLCDVIIMWIPEESEHIEGRSYAQTTRTEFGEYLALGKKIIFGCYDQFPGKRYFKTKLDEYEVDSKIHRSLLSCIDSLKEYIKLCEERPQTWFTSDTHFGDSRAWELSRRPFKSVEAMDLYMMRKWNDSVKPCDTIYHLGDFGKNEEKYVPFLNGKKILVYGNYERENKYQVIDSLFDKTYKQSVIVTINDKKYCLCHEPLRGRSVMNKHKELYGCIFGHIHGRSKVKQFMAVDVGVDSWYYKPMSIDDCNFFINAVDKGYYDGNVWC